MVVAVALAALTASAHARPGDLDPSFSRDGLVRTSFGDRSEARAVAIQPDGKIVVAGQSQRDVALARYQRSGRLDPSFSQNGLLRMRFGYYSLASTLAIQPDGKILVLGHIFAGPMEGSVLARLTPSGALDPSFSGDGLVTDFGNYGYGDMALDGDGRILLAGGRSGPQATSEAAVARLQPDGMPDTSFSGDGVAIASFGDYGSGARVAVQADGSPVLGGAVGDGLFDEYDLGIARFEPDGDPDPSFSGDGARTLDIGPVDLVRRIALRPDGRIVAGGAACSSYSDLYGSCGGEVAQFNPDGSLDESFGEDGVVRLSLNRGLYFGASPSSAALTEDGGTVLAGGTLTERQGYGLVDFAVARLDATGSLDASFRGGGIWTTDFRSEYDDADDVALQRDGKIVAVGRSNAVGSSYRDSRVPQIALARYEVESGPRDADADGVRDAADRCPFRFGGNRGCRWYRRSLTMKFAWSENRFRGVLKSLDANCVSHEKVRVLRARPGRDKKVDTTHTSFFGQWRVVARRRPGRYYARALASQSTASEASGGLSGGRRYGRCLKARSAVVEVGR